MYLLHPHATFGQATLAGGAASYYFVVKWFASAALSEESSHTHVGQSLVHKREIGSFVTTLSSAYYYDHQAGGLPDDRSKT